MNEPGKARLRVLLGELEAKAAEREERRPAKLEAMLRRKLAEGQSPGD